MKRTVITAIRHRETLVQIRPCANPDFKSGRFRWTGLILLRFSCVWSFDLPDLRVSFDIAALIQFPLCVETVLLLICIFDETVLLWIKSCSKYFTWLCLLFVRFATLYPCLQDWLWLFQVPTFGNQTVSESVRLQFRSHASWPWHVTSESSFRTPPSRDHRRTDGWG